MASTHTEFSRRMARNGSGWEKDWASSVWARADGLWKREDPARQAAEDAAWREASREQGGFLTVMWNELCQLADDVRPRCEPPAPADR